MDGDVPDRAAAAVVFTGGPVEAGLDSSEPGTTSVGAGPGTAGPARRHEGQLLGLAAQASELPVAIPWALEHGLDLVLLEGCAPVEGTWPELAGPPDLSDFKMPIVPGDHVVFPRSAGVWVEVEEERLLVCRVRELLGVIETGP